MIKNIIMYPDEILTKIAAPFYFDREDPTILVADMFDTMKHYNGIGISAPQIGKQKMVLIIDTTDIFKDQKFANEWPLEKGTKLVMINPKLEYKESLFTIMNEGCLSLPGFYLDVKRPAGCVVSYFDENCNQQTVSFGPYHSHVFLHEYDHLFGKLLIHYMYI